MRFLPLIFGFFLARFPSGLFVYWITSNCITFAQNYVIYYVLPHKKTADADEEKAPVEAEKKAPTATNKENREAPKNQKPAQQPKKSGRAKNRKKKKVGKRK
jgi:YidC/Oxa1 family membrane protein insertase